MYDFPRVMPGSPLNRLTLKQQRAAPRGPPFFYHLPGPSVRTRGGHRPFVERLDQRERPSGNFLDVEGIRPPSADEPAQQPNDDC